MCQRALQIALLQCKQISSPYRQFTRLNCLPNVSLIDAADRWGESIVATPVSEPVFKAG